MGRAFEFRKERKFKRWAKMAVQFTRLGKEIAMAVKAGGPNLDSNSRLRTAVQNAKAVNMPKDRIDAAIKRAGLKTQLQSTGGGSDTNIMSGKDLQAVTLAIGMTNVHTTSECIAIKDMEKTVELVAAIIQEVK